MASGSLPGGYAPINQDRRRVGELERLQRKGQLGVYTVATLPSPSTSQGCVIFVSNETGGATLAFSDGTNWRRVQDRAVVA